MNNYIKSLIVDNKIASEKVQALEQTVAAYPIVDEKSKVNFGNLCIALKGFRMVAEATECLLINENVLKDDNGEFYQKVDENTPIVPPSTEGKPGSDFDKDGNHQEGK